MVNEINGNLYWKLGLYGGCGCASQVGFKNWWRVMNTISIFLLWSLFLKQIFDLGAFKTSSQYTTYIYVSLSFPFVEAKWQNIIFKNVRFTFTFFNQFQTKITQHTDTVLLLNPNWIANCLYCTAVQKITSDLLQIINFIQVHVCVNSNYLINEYVSTLIEICSNSLSIIIINF